MELKNPFIYLIIALSIFSCTNSVSVKEKNKLFTKLDESQTGINFNNAIENQKELNIFTYRNFYNGGGVAIGDINNDSLPDIFFTANQGPNKLYLNKGNFEFEDISKKANIGGKNLWSTGVVLVDINNDGLLDIYVCNAGNVKGDNLKNELFINNGDLTFTEKAAAYNLAENGLTTHAAFFDYDKDGDLDVYILNNSFIPVSSLNYANKRELRAKDWDVPNLLKGGGDKLLRNDNGKFVDVSEEAGIFGSLIGFGLGVTVGDINNDSYLDIYVSNDFYEHDYLYINNQDGTFKESIKDWTAHISQSSMGADMADINNDGNPDVFVTDMLPEHNKRVKETTQFETYDVYQRKLGLDFDHQYMQNSLQLNLGDNHMAEIANFSGVAKTDWSWGALLFDMDNDGYKDIYVCNGIYHDLTNQDFMTFFANDIIQNMVLTGKKEEVSNIINKMPSNPITNYAFKNSGNLAFSNVTTSWGFDKPTFSNGAAYGDLDNDGDLDLVINNVNQQALVYRNNAETLTENNYIKIQLKGKSPNSNAIGSKIKLFSNKEIILQEVIPSRGFQSSVDYLQTIGIGTKKIDSIQVIWPDDSFQTLTGILSDKKYIFKQEDALQKLTISNNNNNTIFSEIDTNLESHKENRHNDFNYEGLIPQMMSKEGPTISVADVNGDGLDDVFIGGAKGQESKLFFQTNSGDFVISKSQGFEKDKDLEDTASAFFDADNDGDLDLMVGTGGNETQDEKNYKTRLYLNNGKGYFSIANKTIQATFHNASVITPCDFDNDGDIDVFVGSRSVPAIYGINAKHQLLENDGEGGFKDVTKNRAYAFNSIGMVTDASWHDFDGDGKKDLILTEDWGSPRVFKNNSKQLIELSTNLSEFKGWWNAVKVVDVNHDGLPDLILGNNGLNLPYKPSKEKPIKVFINDFDNNGTIEQILTETIDGKNVPIITKHELTAQIVSLKKKNLKFSEYATKSIEELFSEEIIAQSIVREVTTSQSVVALNNTSGDFKILPLPNQVQFSSVEAIAVLDANNDSNLDLVLGGNQYNFKPQYARLDANYGSLLLGDGSGMFDWVAYEDSGFFVKGEVKNISIIKTKQGTGLIVGINSEQPRIFRINNE
ncbi:VCBS repeat-containing protein [Tenacibaculum tangerinum]|uniref:VCBS repeat-containing protein n=1 Tax=Tenacibaculum tangerinum TaxID=3038772 RepID=A0ABY8L3Y6_9FLAO|nr:VCBS repeat-containing protein [Tenacibaculum tangerinum]WGH76090.1 VCBS repeat-containing protein [Tenacibaculum tangerinum]